MVRRSQVLKKRPNLFAKPIARLYVLHDSVNSFLPRAGSKGFDRFLLGRYFTLFLFAENLGHYRCLSTTYDGTDLRRHCYMN